MPFQRSALSFRQIAAGFMRAGLAVAGIAWTGAAREIHVPLAQTQLDGAALGVRPGDAILLEPGVRPFLRIEHLVGRPDRYITITNAGGEVVVRNADRYYDIWIGSSRYFRLTGTGAAGLRHGLRLDGTNRDGSALMVGGLSSDCEIDHLHIAHAGFAGMAIKTDGAVGTTMDNVRIHDNYIHDTGGEGLYVGETKTPGQNFRHLRIWNNVTARTGYEACQVANAVEDVRVDHNVFYRAGLREDLWQDNNFQVGATSTLRFDHNIVIGAYTNLIIATGGAPKVFEDNFLAGAAAGPAFFLTDSNVPTRASTSFRVERNVIRDISPTQPVVLFTGEKSRLLAARNTWAGARRFIKFQPIIDLSAMIRLEENREEPAPWPRFKDEAHDDFTLPVDDPYRRRGIGLEP